MQIVIVTDDVPAWSFLKDFTIISAEDYLKGSPYQSKSLRVINLCNSYQYQTVGYYVSLLAVAQDQKVSPSIQTIQDGMNPLLSKQFLQEIDVEIQNSLKEQPTNEVNLPIYFGGCPQESFAAIAKKIYDMFPLPLITLNLIKKKSLWIVDKFSLLSIRDIPATEKDFMQERAKNYLSKKCFYAGLRSKKPFFHMAILIDKEEPKEFASSNPLALEKFVAAGQDLGIQVDFIGKNDMKSIPEYAGLFIRNSTDIFLYTYQFARYAAQENLVVIDDPQSMLKCGNKVYQAVSFQNHNINTPHTIVVSKHQKNNISVTFPCVIKRPDSGFSLDVVKAENQKELKKALNDFFEFSDLVVVQAFLPTEFDWRIGIIDRKPLYAARYYMAKDHWQVINWDSTTNRDGFDVTVPLNEVPEDVMELALRAANVIGDSLYGVDIKTHNNQNYVVEVNDNPGIDAGEEDKILGDELYKKIMTVFLQRMQAKHGLPIAPAHESKIAEPDEI